MSLNDLRVLLRAKPFVPFRVVVSDGTIYTVAHPELCMAGLSSVIIGYPLPGVPDAYDRYDIVSMQLIVQLDPGPTPPVEEAAGQQQ